MLLFLWLSDSLTCQTRHVLPDLTCQVSCLFLSYFVVCSVAESCDVCIALVCSVCLMDFPRVVTPVQ